MNPKNWKNKKEEKEAYSLARRSLVLFKKYNQQDLKKGKELTKDLEKENLNYALRQVFKETGYGKLSQQEYVYWLRIVKRVVKEIERENKLIKEILDLEIERKLKEGAYHNEKVQEATLGDDYDSITLDQQPEKIKKSFWKLR